MPIASEQVQVSPRLRFAATACTRHVATPHGVLGRNYRTHWPRASERRSANCTRSAAGARSSVLFTFRYKVGVKAACVASSFSPSDKRRAPRERIVLSARYWVR
ncbi:hypothetical protein EVAR_66307_1 [Eumeta japonica]|uniref:Uncharacterized protein n=1 Tax=Eumeta variegata TaxID=151549 RepID=A0A4C1ZBK4_EUMVA|nr:hypothetical protein EVAR_66307_1 [Eumeta japonica]